MRAGRPRERVASLNQPPIDERLASAGLPPLPRTAWIEVDLDALTNNVAVLRELAGPGVEVHPVVKGNAYGHGMPAVARALEAAGVDGLCVATFDEAVALRAAGISIPVLVLFPIPAALAAEARSRRIAVTASDRALLDELLAAAQATAQPPLDVHLELETGLGRGGFGRTEAAQAGRDIDQAPGVRLVGAWTHLQAPEDESRSRSQATEFEWITHEVEARGLGLRRQHVSASGSLILGEGLRGRGVRPGLATYGLIPDELLEPLGSSATGARRVRPESERLRPILSLHARPVRVAGLPAGTGISYGPTFTTKRPSRIATLPLGYGDGWSRALSNRAQALVRGRRVPLVGNVAMDSVMADVTDVPGEPVTVHDEFTLIGEQGDDRIEPADVARARGTNSWEVVTNLAARLPRVYHSASVPREMRTLGGDAFANADDATAAGRRSMRP